jgi:hypothetical protein
VTTILGAGGSIGRELAKILAAKYEPFRLVSRNPKPFAGAELLAATSPIVSKDSSSGGIERCASGGRAEVRGGSLAGDVASDHGEYHRSLQTRPGEAAVLRQRLYVWEGQWADDGGDPVRSLLQEGRNSGKIATTLMNEVKA